MAIEKFVAELSWGVPVPVTALKSSKPANVDGVRTTEDESFISFFPSPNAQTAVSRVQAAE